MFNPLVQFDVRPTDRVGVIGIGGLGHMALMFLKAWGCEVVAFSSSNKQDEAKKLGAHRVINSRDRSQLEAAAGSFDLILNTVNAEMDWPTYVECLAPRGRLHTVGAVEKPMLGRYQIEKELGKGAMGVVYLGKDPKIGRVVAIKTMALSDAFDGDELVDARERFFREAETAGRLQHQNIVTIFDAGEEHDLAYIAMEFLKGRDLVEYCKSDNLLPVPLVASLVARVAEALAYAHKQMVVHRDIKPANIMYERESDTVKVTDFGIARITDSSKTKTGLVLGTPSFMSPEQLAGKKVDGRSDLYSLGVMLFQLLTGVLPFRGDSMAELMFKIANEEAPDVRVIRPELSTDMARIVALMLHKRPELRYQNGEQVASELRATLSETLSVSRGEGEPGAKATPVTAPDFASTNPNVAAVYDRTVAQAAVRAADMPKSGSTDIEI